MRFSPSARACRLTFPPMLRIMKAPKGVFFMRHAWLIIAHGNFEILEKQLRFLDSENADFFIHVDARVKDFDFAHVRSIPENRVLRFLTANRSPGGIFLRSTASCVCCAPPFRAGTTITIFSPAWMCRSKHGNTSKITFSSVQPGTNFVHFQHKEIIRDHRDRVKFITRSSGGICKTASYALRCAARRASAASVCRPDKKKTRRAMCSKKGANWFSITHALAAYVLSQEDWLRERYRSTFCADEIFLQTLVVNSPFRDTLPPTISATTTKPACAILTGSAASRTPSATRITASLSPRRRSTFFARKFDYRTNAEVVDRLFAHFGEEASD